MSDNLDASLRNDCILLDDGLSLGLVDLNLVSEVFFKEALVFSELGLDCGQTFHVVVLNLTVIFLQFRDGKLILADDVLYFFRLGSCRNLEFFVSRLTQLKLIVPNFKNVDGHSQFLMHSAQ